MAIVKWQPYRRTLSPFGNWFDMSERMNQLLDNVFGEDGDVENVTWGPNVDVIENDDNFQIMAELPGIKMDDVKISLSDSVLILKGEKKNEVSENKRNCYRVERRYGQFQRSFSLPSNVSADQVRANLENGVLTITVPKAEETKAREIPIKIK